MQKQLLVPIFFKIHKLIEDKPDKSCKLKCVAIKPSQHNVNCMSHLFQK